jgi:peptidoglycan/LPS O-acetylase OafA/YrhL
MSAIEKRGICMLATFDTITSSRIKILGFNGIRGLCVILVFLWHKSGVHLHTAEIGVWTFLALSGFLLIPELHAQRVLVESGSSTEMREAGKFWFKRATRILPVYYSLILFLYVFSGYYAWAGSDLGFRYHVFYLSNFFFALVAPADTLGGPVWRAVDVGGRAAILPCCASYILALALASSHRFLRDSGSCLWNRAPLAFGF